MKKMILILTILFCSMTFSATALAEDEKIVIIPGDRGKVPSLFGLSLTSSDYFAMTLIFDTLTWKDADGVIPALADGWEVSDDGKEWTFYLTRNARWHDGELFTADNVKFTFDYMKDHPLDAYMWLHFIKHIESVDVVDDYTVRIYLSDSQVSFLVDTAGSMPIIPEHIWKDVSEPFKFGGNDGAVIGIGPMKFVKINQYEANDDYFNGKLIVDKLALGGIALDDNAFALDCGHVDEAPFWGSDIMAVNQFAGDPDFEIITGPSFCLLQVIFNCERYPTNIKKFRQAVAYGIDREVLVEKALHGGGVVANTGIMHHDSIWYNPDCEGYGYDVDKANAILDSLGFTDTNSDGIREYPAGAEKCGDLEFTLYSMQEYSRETEIIQSQMEDIGIKMHRRLVGVVGLFMTVGSDKGVAITVGDYAPMLHNLLWGGAISTLRSIIMGNYQILWS
jgi:peptide/nickel transport system substrate-binding protein